MAGETCSQAVPKSVPGTAVYRRCNSEHSAVYQVLQGHLETWLAGCRQSDEEGFSVAAYIEQDFRKYLACGIHDPWLCPGTLRLNSLKAINLLGRGRGETADIKCVPVWKTGESRKQSDGDITNLLWYIYRNVPFALTPDSTIREKLRCPVPQNSEVGAPHCKLIGIDNEEKP